MQKLSDIEKYEIKIDPYICILRPGTFVQTLIHFNYNKKSMFRIRIKLRNLEDVVRDVAATVSHQMNKV
jgi:hypothetical protein